jgi:hypothetical protein
MFIGTSTDMDTRRHTRRLCTRTADTRDRLSWIGGQGITRG